MKKRKRSYRFRDGLTGRFITEKRAKKLSAKRVTRVSLRKRVISIVDEEGALGE
jgi:hypothetical protein